MSHFFFNLVDTSDIFLFIWTYTNFSYKSKIGWKRVRNNGRKNDIPNVEDILKRTIVKVVIFLVTAFVLYAMRDEGFGWRYFPEESLSWLERNRLCDIFDVDLWKISCSIYASTTKQMTSPGIILPSLKYPAKRYNQTWTYVSNPLLFEKPPRRSWYKRLTRTSQNCAIDPFFSFFYLLTFCLVLSLLSLLFSSRFSMFCLFFSFLFASISLSSFLIPFSVTWNIRCSIQANRKCLCSPSRNKVVPGPFRKKNRAVRIAKEIFLLCRKIQTSTRFVAILYIYHVRVFIIFT